MFKETVHVGIRNRTAVNLQTVIKRPIEHVNCCVGLGDSVLVHAGAGGLGYVAIQLAQSRGAKVFATVSPEKKKSVETLGVTAISFPRNPSGGRDGAPDDLGWAGSRASHLSQGDRRSREVRGGGEARHRKHPDEGLPRPVRSVPSLLIRGTDPLRSDRADIRAPQDPTPSDAADRIHVRVF
jgi:hypothetical protein